MYNDIDECIYHNTIGLMASSIQRINIIALYRAKLHICRDMGHICGSWNRIYVYKTNKLQRHFKKKHLINQINPGTIIWNNVRNQYKLQIHETDSDGIDELIDIGFYWLSQINNLYGKFKRTPYYKMENIPPLRLNWKKF